MADYQQVFKDSFQRVRANAQNYDQFIARFYDILLESSEEIAGLFTDSDMHRVARMLRKSFAFVLQFSESKISSSKLEDLAEKHRKMAIKDEYYQQWLDALILSVAEFDNQFTSQVDLAWRIALLPGIEFMKHHHN